MLTINPFDIEIFILTYNRKEFLKKALESVLNQTIKDLKITVVDNGSTDGTEEFVRSYLNRYENLNYVRHNENIEVLENIKFTVGLAKEKYMLMFHDDDFIHPQYIETVLNIISKHDDIDFLYPKTTIFQSEDKIDNQIFSDIKYQIYDRQHFTAKMFINKGTENVVFPSAVYRTANVKQAILHEAINTTGTIADNVIIVESVINGKCVYIENSLYYYRSHPSQESQVLKLYPDEIICCLKFFKEKLNSDFYSKLIFNVFSYYRLLRLYKHFGLYKNTKLKELEDDAYKGNAVTIYDYILFKPYGILLRPFNALLKKILQKVKHQNETFRLEGEAK